MNEHLNKAIEMLPCRYKTPSELRAYPTTLQEARNATDAGYPIVCHPKIYEALKKEGRV